MFSWLYGDPAEVADRRRFMEERVAEAAREVQEMDRRRKARRIRKLLKLALSRQLKGQR